MARASKYSPEVRERAVKMVSEQRRDHPSECSAITSVSSKFGMTAETLRSWVRRAQIDSGLRDGVTSEEREKMFLLERENKELRRANEILKAASVFFATELDGQTKK